MPCKKDLGRGVLRLSHATGSESWPARVVLHPRGCMGAASSHVDVHVPAAGVEALSQVVGPRGYRGPCVIKGRRVTVDLSGLVPGLAVEVSWNGRQLPVCRGRCRVVVDLAGPKAYIGLPAGCNLRMQEV